MGQVSIVRTCDGVTEALARALDLIGGVGHFVGTGDTVLLKPNLNGLEGFTNIELVESLIRLLLDYGVRTVSIGEATFGDASMTTMFFAKTGYAELAQRYGLDLINFNASEPVAVPVPQPLVCETVSVAREAVEADKIINLPNMKVHYATNVTLAMKNLKGVLVGHQKRRFHEIGLDKAIADLNSAVVPALNIADCISCMERMGPRGGDIVDLNLILAGSSAAEVDCVGCDIMGYEVDEVKHLAYYLAAAGIDHARINVVGETVDAVRRPFCKVEPIGMVPDAMTVHNSDACSACENALLLSCMLLQGDLSRSVDLYMGTVVDQDQGDPADLRVAFGNCCQKGATFDRKVIGCPPYPFALGECLKDALT